MYIAYSFRLFRIQRIKRFRATCVGELNVRAGERLVQRKCQIDTYTYADVFFSLGEHIVQSGRTLGDVRLHYRALNSVLHLMLTDVCVVKFILAA